MVTKIKQDMLKVLKNDVISTNGYDMTAYAISQDVRMLGILFRDTNDQRDANLLSKIQCLQPELPSHKCNQARKRILNLITIMMQ